MKDTQDGKHCFEFKVKETSSTIHLHIEDNFMTYHIPYALSLC
jgi:hypothetical protein